MRANKVVKLLIGIAIGVAATIAQATPINGGFSVSGGVTPLGAATMDAATGLHFLNPGGANSCTGSIAVAVGGTAALCGSAATTSTTLDIAAGSIIGSGAVFIILPIGSWITLSVGGVSFDLSAITNIGRSTIGIPSLDLIGTGVLHATGFDATSGFFHLTAQGTNNTFSFSSTQIASRVPEPATLGLLGIALVGLGFVRRRT